MVFFKRGVTIPVVISYEDTLQLMIMPFLNLFDIAIGLRVQEMAFFRPSDLKIF